MIVCSCLRVSDREIRRAVVAGASTIEEVARTTGAGTGCTGCHATIVQIISEEGAETARNINRGTASSQIPRR